MRADPLAFGVSVQYASSGNDFEKRQPKCASSPPASSALGCVAFWVVWYSNQYFYLQSPSLTAFTSGACFYQLGLYSPPGSYSSLEAVLTVWLAFTFRLELIYPTVFTLSIWVCFFLCKEKGIQLLGKLIAEWQGVCVLEEYEGSAREKRDIWLCLCVLSECLLLLSL